MRERESLAAQGISFYFLCILDSGELHRNGDKGSLAISTSVKSIFSIGLLVFELDFRLFDCKELKSGRLDHATRYSCQNSIKSQEHKDVKDIIEAVISFPTLADALLACFPLEPFWFFSLLYLIRNFLFSSSSILFSSKSNLTYTFKTRVQALIHKKNQRKQVPLVFSPPLPLYKDQFSDVPYLSLGPSTQQLVIQLFELMALSYKIGSK